MIHQQLSQQWLGLSPYLDALAQQTACVPCARTGHSTILGCEHPATITLGKRATLEQDVAPTFAGARLPVIQTDRGGQATLHSPGQLVIYPILNLRDWDLGVRAYVDELLMTTAGWLAAHGLMTEQRDGIAGLFTAKGKVAFVGVRIEQGVTRHGLSINIRNDVSLFQTIRSCGRWSETFDRLDSEVGLDLLFAEWCELFRERLYRRSNSFKDCSSAR